MSVSPSARVPLPELLRQVERELAALEAIYNTSYRSGTLLGDLNGRLQSRGYFRRVPSNPATEALDANLRRAASERGLQVVALAMETLAAVQAQPDVVLDPGQRWQPTLEQLRGLVLLRLDLLGAAPEIAGFINTLPNSVERLVVITGSEGIPGGVRLLGEAYFERDLPPPKVDLRWPPLEERLHTAGHDPADPSLRRQPAYEKLRQAVDLGRAQLPDVRHTLQVSADFPRWLLRSQFFEARGIAAMSTRGELLLGTTAPAR